MKWLATAWSVGCLLTIGFFCVSGIMFWVGWLVVELGGGPE